MLARDFRRDRGSRTKLPVKIHLPSGSPRVVAKKFGNGIKRWNEHLPIQEVAPNEAAEHRRDLGQQAGAAILGITRLTVSTGQPHVQIYMLRPTYYLPEIPERTLQYAFLHELGHGLGIFGHSDSRQDLMFAARIVAGEKGKSSEIRFAPISDRDVRTLKHVYATNPVPPDVSSPEPLEWGVR